MKPTVLVTSAGGKTGQHVVPRLIKKGHFVRAFVRRNDARADRFRKMGADVIVGNQYAMSDMRKAMDGIQYAYHCAPTAANGLHFGAVFAAAAAEQKLEHVVVLGQWLADEKHPSIFTREAWLNERLIELLPCSHTMVNVGWFADNYLMVLEPAVQLGILPMPLGPGHEKKDVPPSLEDLADFCVEALVNPEDHSGKWYRPTGPNLVSPDDVAEAIGRAAQRTVKYDNISEAMFLKALKALQPPMYSEAMLTQLNIYVEEYRRGAFAIGGATNHIETVLNRRAEDMDTIAAREVALRPEANRTFANKMRALQNFGKILVTRKPDTARIAQKLAHFDVPDMRFVPENPVWKKRRALAVT